MSGDGTPVDVDQATRDAVTASVEAARDAMAAGIEAAIASGAEAVFQAGSAKRKRAEESLEEQKRETEKVHAEALAALEAAVKVKKEAETGAAVIWRKARAERAALDAEKAAMEKTYSFQTLLSVGGVRFETSLPTLTSVPDTYLEVMFSGRYPLAADPDGAFFLDRESLFHQELREGLAGARDCSCSPRHRLAFGTLVS